jgi:lauroyl/myristoyl acyltransferase
VSLWSRSLARSGRVNVAGVFWRRLAYAGARYGPKVWVRYSPSVFGLAFAAALPELRRTVRDNLRQVLGPRPPLVESLDVARTFVTFAHCLAESLGSERAEAKGAVRSAQGRAALVEALRAGKGVIVVTAHVGVWDAAASLLGDDLDAEVLVVMAREGDDGARSLHDAVRRRGGISIVHVGEHPLDAVALLAHLRRGGVVAVQLDRAREGGDNLEIELFSRSFRVPRGPFQLAALSGAPLVPVFCGRQGYFDYRVIVGAPVRLERRASLDRQREAACACVASLERFVRAYPTQWFHFGGLEGSTPRRPVPDAVPQAR